MIEQFPDAYPAYKQSTKMLVGWASGESSWIIEAHSRRHHTEARGTTPTCAAHRVRGSVIPRVMSDKSLRSDVSPRRY